MSIPRVGSGTQACAACKYQRRKCSPDCILAPYFPPHHQKQFLNVHKLFGVSNILKIISNLHPLEKNEAIRTMIFQADVRANDPVGGCYRIIRELQRQIDHGKAELDLVLHQLAIFRSQAHHQALQGQTMDPYPVNSYINPMHYSHIQHQQQSVNQWAMQDPCSFSKINMDAAAASSSQHDIKPTLVIGMFDERFDTKELVAFSDRVKLKEEDIESIQNVQEHDLKGAASLFTLTNCNH